MTTLSLKNPPEIRTLGSFKKYAKQLKREAGTTLSQAQETLARALGHSNFHAARNALSSPSRDTEEN